jgi:hypothetical protein
VTGTYPSRLTSGDARIIDWLLCNIDNSSTSQPTSGLGSVALTTSGDPNLGSVVDINGSTTYTMRPLTSITNCRALFTTPAPNSSRRRTNRGWNATHGDQRRQTDAADHFLENSSGTHISYVVTYGANNGVTENAVITQARLSFDRSAPSSAAARRQTLRPGYERLKCRLSIAWA